jgi:hypothetical protein
LDEPRPGAPPLRIEVADARDGFGKAMPELPPEQAESGRGLPLVEALAARWGVASRSPSGKTAWADLDLDLNGGSGL